MFVRLGVRLWCSRLCLSLFFFCVFSLLYCYSDDYYFILFPSCYFALYCKLSPCHLFTERWMHKWFGGCVTALAVPILASNVGGQSTASGESLKEPRINIVFGGGGPKTYKLLPNDQKIVLKPVCEIRFIRQIKVWIKHHNIIRWCWIFSEWPAFWPRVTMCLTRKLAICVTYSKWCQRFLWHQIASASCEFYV